MKTLTKPRVLFLLRERNNYYTDDPPPSHGYVLSSGLYNSAKFVCEMLATKGYATDIQQVRDSNAIHAAVVKFKADVVIIEAFWVPPYKFDDLLKAVPKVVFVVRNHSDIAFLSMEGCGVGWTLDYAKKSNVIMTCNSPGAFSNVQFLIDLELKLSNSQLAKQTAYLPNYYPDSSIIDQKKYVPGGTINVGCFGAVRPLKNQLIQAIAALKYAHKHNQILNFHINGTRIEGNASPILKNIIQLFDHFPQHNLVTHPWMDHADFISLVRSMDVTMQVSFSETFCIVAADAVVNGIPVVGSNEIVWLDRAFQANINDSYDISNRIDLALRGGNYMNVNGLKKFNSESVNIWLNFLKRFNK